MGHREYHLHNGKRGAALAVRVISNAPNDEIINILQDGTVRIGLASPPSEAKINQALSKFLAKVLNVALSKIEIVAGQTGQDKLVSVTDLGPEFVHQKILEHLSS